MMTAAQWIQLLLSVPQLVFSVGLVLASVLLFLATWKYMKHTKRMADEMHEQSAIMKREFEIRIAPIVEIHIRKKITNVLDPVVEIDFQNIGHYPVLLESIRVGYVNPHGPGKQLEYETPNSLILLMTRRIRTYCF